MSGPDVEQTAGPGEAEVLLSVRETARRLGVHENTVRNWADSGVLTPHTLPGSGFRRFEEREVNQLRHSMTPRGGEVVSEEEPLTWESAWMGVDETLGAWLDRVHPLQYGFDDLGRYFSPDPAPGRIASGGRFNRCPTCEQWSPCTVRERVRTEVAAAEERGARAGRRRCAEELRPAFAGLAIRTEGWHDSEVAAILRDLDKRWRAS